MFIYIYYIYSFCRYDVCRTNRHTVHITVYPFTTSRSILPNFSRVFLFSLRLCFFFSRFFVSFPLVKNAWKENGSGVSERESKKRKKRKESLCNGSLAEFFEVFAERILVVVALRIYIYISYREYFIGGRQISVAHRENGGTKRVRGRSRTRE